MASQTAATTAAIDETPAQNPLVLAGGSSELQVILHPLVLLSISDYIARHTLRQRTDAIVGGLLGQQNGREITIEHAFDVHMNEENAVEPAAFHTRLEQMRTVHKDRQLDLVGWFTLLPTTGPDRSILGVHRFFLDNYNDSAILLGFHPDAVLKHTAGGKLPLTIYESNVEVEGGGKATADQDAEDKRMDDGEAGIQLRFRELAYSVETDETEMIGMNYVAAGGASAAAASAKEDKPSRSVEATGKGKRRLVEDAGDEKTDSTTVNEADVLTREEEEMIATLTTKANAIKMLQARIQLITTYLEHLPASYVSGGKAEDENMDDEHTTPSPTILRQIQALVSRLDLVIPSDREAFEQEMLQESNDVQLVELLNKVMQSTDQARDVGKKFSLVESSKQNRRGGGDYGLHPSSMMGAVGDVMIK